MNELEKLPGRTAQLNGKEYLYFSGTSYLGMADNALFNQYLQEGIQCYGGHYGGSRLGSIPLRIFEQAEQFLATFTRAPAALVVSSGSLAGQLLIKYLNGQFYFAPGVHPALWNGQDAFEGTFEQWQDWLLVNLTNSGTQNILVTNSIDPLGVQSFDFAWLPDLVNKVGEIILVVDDSHGLGVIGKEGRGIYSFLPKLPGLEVVVVSSLGKALGVSGGAVLGSKNLIKKLWHSPFFGGASPPPPAFLHAMINSIEAYRQALVRLRKNIIYFHQLLPARSRFQSVEGYPVFSVSDKSLAPRLKEQGILISQLPYPTPESPLLTRIVLNAAHREADLELLAALINRRIG